MIHLKTPKEIEIMRESGKILATIMNELKNNVKPGISTQELEKLAQELVFKYNSKCSFKGYKSSAVELVDLYPACLCTCVNEEIVHAVPSDRILKEGDILSLDMGVYYQGFHSDMAITIPVGNIKPEAQRLIKVTKKALKRGISNCKIGNTFGDIGNAIQRYVESQGFEVVKDLCGHGIGKNIHEEPQILNYGKRKTGPKITEGMVFCLEPMVVTGNPAIRKSKDGFGYLTLDNSLSAHFEHTVAMTAKGCQVLTKIV